MKVTSNLFLRFAPPLPPLPVSETFQELRCTNFPRGILKRGVAAVRGGENCFPARQQRYSLHFRRSSLNIFVCLHLALLLFLWRFLAGLKKINKYRRRRRRRRRKRRGGKKKKPLPIGLVGAAEFLLLS